MRITAQVTITPRPEILDPQGKAIGSALERLGFGEVRRVRSGKIFEIEIEAADREQARVRLEEMCARLLSNPIVEDYRFELEEAGS